MQQALEQVHRDGGLGVGSSYILEEFTTEAQAFAALAASAPEKYGVDPQYPMDITNPNFHQLKGVMAHGPDAKGRGLVCPRDGFEDCAIVE